MGRWGEKVPAAAGTVADRFAWLQLSALHLEWAFLPAEGTRPSAVGTGLLLAQSLGLLFEEGVQGALRESGGGSQGDLLHDASCVGVVTTTKEKVPSLPYRDELDTAKLFMTSSCRPVSVWGRSTLS